MRHRRLLAVAALLAGCGGAPAAGVTTTSASAARDATSPDEERAERVRELETQLALRTAEVRDLRGELELGRVVRIGGGRITDRSGEMAADDASLPPQPDVREEPPDDRSGSRPVLRLHGAPPRPAALAEGITPFPGSQPTGIVPPPPQAAAFGRLPPMITPDVPAIPHEPLTIAPTPPRAERAPVRVPQDDPIVREYQAALAHVEGRRWDAGLAAMTRFVASHPDHPYADNALYWQAEVHYARREYRSAIERLETLVARYPQGNKVADALVRIGAALEHLGDREGARAYFRRVREQYPDSVAARMALREET